MRTRYLVVLALGGTPEGGDAPVPAPPEPGRRLRARKETPLAHAASHADLTEGGEPRIAEPSRFTDI